MSELGFIGPNDPTDDWRAKAAMWDKLVEFCVERGVVQIGYGSDLDKIIAYIEAAQGAKPCP